MLKPKRILAVIFFILSVLLLQEQPVELPSQQKPIVFLSNDIEGDTRLTLGNAIDSAENSVLLSIYALTDIHIIKALRNASERGVKTELICDPSVPWESLQLLGGKVDIIRRKSLGLMHQKILIVDKKQIWIGSANMTTESLRDHKNLMIGFYAPEAAASLQQALHEAPTTMSFDLNEQHITLTTLPDNGETLDRILRLIKNARHHIHIGMFTYTNQELHQALIEAHQRGVDVQLILDTRQVYATSRSIVQNLSDLNIPVRLNRGGSLFHHKFAWIDDTLVVGSANWTKAAFTQNDELVAIIHPLSALEVEGMDKLWWQLIHGSTPFTQDTLNQVP